MTDIFRLLTPEEVAALDSEPHWTEQHPPRVETPHCLCGRFAKYLGGRNYYNGTYDCYSFDVECSRCGIVTVECV